MIGYSRGRNIHDNKPRQMSARDFWAFVETIERDRASQKEGAAYIAGPLNGAGRRCAEGAQPRRWLAVDIDRIDADRQPAVRMWFAQFSGCAWPTHSSKPDAPRERVLIELDRDATRDECMAIGRTLCADLATEFGDAVMVDESTFRPEQPVFVPPTGVQFARFQGEPLDVDRYVEAAPPVHHQVPATVDPRTGETGAKVEAGERHEYLLRWAAQLNWRGMPPEAIRTAVLAENKRACHPPKPVADVEGIVQYVVTKYSDQHGRDQKDKRAKEYADALRTKPKTQAVPLDPLDVFGKWVVTDEQVDEMKKTRPIWLQIIAQSHLSVWVSPAGDGKTTLAMEAGGALAPEFQVLYFQEDAPAGDLPALHQHAKDHGYRMLNSTLAGSTAEDQVRAMEDLARDGADLSRFVFILDTLKKYADLMSKGGSRAFFKLMRALTQRGATVLLLGHTNKHRGPDGKLMFEGVGDVRNDVDDLFYIDATDKDAMGIRTLTIRPDKARFIARECSFELNTNNRTVRALEQVVDVAASLRAQQQRHDDEPVIAVVRGALAEGGMNFTDLVEKAATAAGKGRATVRRVIEQYIAEDPADPHALWLETRLRSNNARHVTLRPSAK